MSEEKQIKTPAYVWCCVTTKPRVAKDFDIKAVKRPPRLTQEGDAMEKTERKICVDFSTDGLYDDAEVKAYRNHPDNKEWFDDAESVHLVKVTVG